MNTANISKLYLVSLFFCLVVIFFLLLNGKTQLNQVQEEVISKKTATLFNSQEVISKKIATLIKSQEVISDKIAILINSQEVISDKIATLINSQEVISKKVAPPIYPQEVTSKKVAPPIYPPLANKMLGPPGASPAAEELDRLWNYIYSLQYHCEESEYFGAQANGDGPYDLCIEKQFWPLRYSKNYKCLAYLFGIGGNINFDDGLARRGCEVHSFDPSIDWEDGLVRPSGVKYHKIGISNEDKDKDEHGWKIRTLKTLIKELKHSDSYMDYLKIDTDKPGGGGFEDFLLEELINTGLYKCVRQFSMEIHLPGILTDKKWLERYRTMYKLMTTLNDGGWRLFNTTDNVRYPRRTNPGYRATDSRQKQLEGKATTIYWEVGFVNFNVEDKCGKYL